MFNDNTNQHMPNHEFVHMVKNSIDDPTKDWTKVQTGPDQMFNVIAWIRTNKWAQENLAGDEYMVCPAFVKFKEPYKAIVFRLQIDIL